MAARTQLQQQGLLFPGLNGIEVSLGAYGMVTSPADEAMAKGGTSRHRLPASQYFTVAAQTQQEEPSSEFLDLNLGREGNIYTETGLVQWYKQAREDVHVNFGYWTREALAYRTRNGSNLNPMLKQPKKPSKTIEAVLINNYKAEKNAKGEYVITPLDESGNELNIVEMPSVDWMKASGDMTPAVMKSLGIRQEDIDVLGTPYVSVYPQEGALYVLYVDFRYRPVLGSYDVLQDWYPGIGFLSGRVVLF